MGRVVFRASYLGAGAFWTSCSVLYHVWGCELGGEIAPRESPLRTGLFTSLYEVNSFMHKSFVSTAPTYEDSRAKVQGNYFFILPTVPGNCQGFKIGTLIQMRFSVV